MMLHWIQKALPRLSDYTLEWIIRVITVPYYLLYDRNTKAPLVSIAQAGSTEEASELLQKWLWTKNKEAQYVQVAAAVTFASSISTLSWTEISGRHWSSPACWYTCIVLALTAVLSGAQQTMLLESLDNTSLSVVRAHLCRNNRTPNWIYVFAWQSPLMFLSYAMVFYLAGLTSYIASPVVQTMQWDANAKTLLFFVVTATCALTMFVVSSRLVHHTVPEKRVRTGPASSADGQVSQSNQPNGFTGVAQNGFVRWGSTTNDLALETNYAARSE